MLEELLPREEETGCLVCLRRCSRTLRQEIAAKATSQITSRLLNHTHVPNLIALLLVNTLEVKLSASVDAVMGELHHPPCCTKNIKRARGPAQQRSEFPRGPFVEAGGLGRHSSLGHRCWCSSSASAGSTLECTTLVTWLPALPRAAYG